MKYLNLLNKLFLILLFNLVFSNYLIAQASPLNFSLPTNGQIVNISGGTGSPLDYRAFPIAIISTPNPLTFDGIINFHRLFVHTDYFDQNVLFEKIDFKVGSDFSTVPFTDWPSMPEETAGGSTYNIADIFPRNEGQPGENKIYIYAIIKLTTISMLNCKNIRFTISTRFRNIGGPVQHTVISNLYFSKYNNNVAAYNNPDLFIKDNSFDLGEEPYWNQDARDYTKSTSILNTLSAQNLFKTYDGINPNLSLPNFAQRSTNNNLNKLNVWIENKACINTANEAYLSAYWTVARVFEPWGQHWHNYDRFPFAADNKTFYTDPSTGNSEPVEMGNHITLNNPWNYKSLVTKVTIPSGVSPTTYSKFTNSYSGGFLTSIDWNPPNANWYLGASEIFRNLNADPVFCYLAVIEEPYKVNDGFKMWYDIGSNTNITAFALHNNNVATVNSYLASPNNTYKRRLSSGNFSSNIGVILVDNPNELEAINLSLLGDVNTNNFLNNGNIFLTFDEVLWNNWSLVNFAGAGFEFAGANRIRITNLDSASFSGIVLNEGQRGMIGLGFEYFSENLPDSDYVVNLALGAYESFPSNQIGSPTNFSSGVYNNPQFEEDNMIQDLTGINPHSSNGLSQILVFPNPVSDRLFVSFAALKDIENVEINILNADGKKVYSNKFDILKKNNNTMNIETSRLSIGLYLIELRTIHGVQHQKFVKND